MTKKDRPRGAAQRNEAALPAGEANFRLLAEKMKDIIWTQSLDLRTTYVSPSITDVLGFTPEERLAQTVEEQLTPASLAVVLEVMARELALESRGADPDRSATVECEYYHKDGSTRWLENVICGLRDGRGTLVGVHGVSRDITERKRIEAALRESEEKYRNLFENANEAIFVVQDGRLVFSNPKTVEWLEYSAAELMSLPFQQHLHPDDAALVAERHVRRMRGDSVPAVYSFRVRGRTGTERWVAISAVRILWEGRPATLNFASDVTEHRKAEEAVQAALREKEVLLKEVHHRVKNNMQIISSLFSLQADTIKDEEVRRILKEGQSRVRSMALVHEKLYQSSTLSKIDFGGYLQSLAIHLFQALTVDSAKVRLEKDLGEVFLDINTAVPCGLLANELIANALEHAFPGSRRGVIRMGLRRLAGGDVELRVADDGPGFPEGLDFRQTNSLGLQIVNLLVSQLQGTIELDRRTGTAFTIRFPDSRHPPDGSPAAGA